MGKIPDVRVDNLDELIWNTPSVSENPNCDNKKSIMGHVCMEHSGHFGVWFTQIQ